MADERLFIALELPDYVLEALTKLQKQLQALDSGRVIRWTGIDSVHLTLKFIGETSADRKPDIVAALSVAAQPIAPFDLSLQGVGCFPDLRRPRIVWAGCAGDVSTLHSLRDAVEHTVAPMGYPTEDRPFSPHLTLGRARQEARRDTLQSFGERISKLEVGALTMWRVEGMSLMRSELRPSGAIYSRQAYIAFV